MLIISVSCPLRTPVRFLPQPSFGHSAEHRTDASEFLAECDTRRAWLTGFTGSAGCAVVTQNEARCWADGRYFLQAGKQLSSEQVARMAYRCA